MKKLQNEPLQVNGTEGIGRVPNRHSTTTAMCNSKSNDGCEKNQGAFVSLIFFPSFLIHEILYDTRNYDGRKEDYGDKGEAVQWAVKVENFIWTRSSRKKDDEFHVGWYWVNKMMLEYAMEGRCKGLACITWQVCMNGDEEETTKDHHGGNHDGEKYLLYFSASLIHILHRHDSYIMRRGWEGILNLKDHKNSKFYLLPPCGSCCASVYTLKNPENFLLFNLKHLKILSFLPPSCLFQV